MLKEEIELPKNVEQELCEVVSQLDKLHIGIIGIDKNDSTYNLCPLGSAGTDTPFVCQYAGKQKFELDKSNRENYMRFSFVSRHLRWLLGEILTIIDATIDDERKLKATKDLVKDKFSSKISWIYENCSCPEEEQNGLLDEEE